MNETLKNPPTDNEENIFHKKWISGAIIAIGSPPEDNNTEENIKNKPDLMLEDNTTYRLSRKKLKNRRIKRRRR